MNEFNQLCEALNPDVEFDMTQEEYTKLNPKGGHLYIKGSINNYSIPLVRRFDLKDYVKLAEYHLRDKRGQDDYTISVVSRGQEVLILKRSYDETKWSKING